MEEFGLVRESSSFKISVWSAFVPETDLAMDTGPDEPVVRMVTKQSSGLHKEVFGWRMLEDLFAGIADESDREDLKVALFDTLAIEINPKDRSIDNLKSFIDVANRILDANGVEWIGSRNPFGDDDEGKRLNPLLALVNHLSWLISMFKDMPNTSVSVR